MSLHLDIKATLKDAMKAKEATKLAVIRSILAALTNELVASKRTPQDELTDEEVLAVIKRLAKQRQEAITQFTTANRPELAETEQAELEILQTYLPTLMSAEEIRPVAEAKKAELGITDKSKLGVLVGAVMKELSGKADGGEVKAVVESLFSE